MWPIFKAQFSNFNGLGAVKDIILEQNAFNTIFFTCIHNFSALPTSKNRKKWKNGPPYWAALQPRIGV